MRRSEEIDLREGLVYDPYVKGFDSNFWKGDTANLLNDTVRNALKIGDTGLVGSVTSYSQYLYGDFEFGLYLDSTVPDTTDSGERRWGLQNPGDTLERGAVYFAAEHDTDGVDGDTTVTRQLWAVMRDEAGTRQRKAITWDTNWSGGGRLTRFRIKWEVDGCDFLINDTRYATLGDRPDGSPSTFQVNTSIPQALRITKRNTDTTDTASTALKLLTIRHARKVI